MLARWQVTSLDLAIAGGLALWSALEALTVTSAAPLVQLGFALSVALPLALRRALPAPVMVVVAAALVAHAATAGADATFNPFPSLLVATFTVAERIAPVAWSVTLGAVPVVAMMAAHELGYFGSPGIESAGIGFLVFFVGGTWAIGRVVRRRALSEQRTEQEAELLAAEAASAERRRVAHELHDIVAHSLSIVALQAAAAERFVERDPARARTHLEATRRTAQGALDEMRHLLDLLREDEVAYAPQPGISSLPDLIAETEAAGHRCRLTVMPEAESVADGPALTVYRVVQEALTNVRKHAPGAAVDVDVRADGNGLVVAVANTRPTAPGPAPATSGAGRGLLGMGERLRLYGGRLAAGPDERGGWLVRATLPGAVA